MPVSDVGQKCSMWQGNLDEAQVRHDGDVKQIKQGLSQRQVAGGGEGRVLLYLFLL